MVPSDNVLHSISEIQMLFAYWENLCPGLEYARDHSRKRTQFFPLLTICKRISATSDYLIKDVLKKTDSLGTN